jgi:hypothetical protein
MDVGKAHGANGCQCVGNANGYPERAMPTDVYEQAIQMYIWKGARLMHVMNGH